MRTLNCDINGRLVLWRADRCYLEALHNNLKPLGKYTDTLPRGHRPETVLRDAIRCVVKHDILIRPLATSGWYLAREERGETANKYDSWTASVRVNANATGIDILTGHLPQNVIDAIVKNIDALAGIARGTMVSQLLTRIAVELGGVNLRPGRGAGGVYWIPLDATDRWRQAGEAIENCAVETGTVNVYDSGFALDSNGLRVIHDAIVADVSRETSELQAAIESGSLGVKALETKTQICAMLVSRIQAYEEILSQPLSALRALVDTVQTAAVQASIATAAQSQSQDDIRATGTDDIFAF